MLTYKHWRITLAWLEQNQVVTCMLCWPGGCLLGPEESWGGPVSAVLQAHFFLSATECGSVVWGTGTIKQTRAWTGICSVPTSLWPQLKVIRTLRVSLAAGEDWGGPGNLVTCKEIWLRAVLVWVIQTLAFIIFSMSCLAISRELFPCLCQTKRWQH